MSIINRSEDREAFYRHLRLQDKSINQWSRERGLDATAVYAVLGGQAQGFCGMGRLAMWAMGWRLPDALPSRRRRERSEFTKRQPKPHLRLHVDGRIEAMGFRPRRNA